MGDIPPAFRKDGWREKEGIRRKSLALPLAGGLPMVAFMVGIALPPGNWDWAGRRKEGNRCKPAVVDAVEEGTPRLVLN